MDKSQCLDEESIKYRRAHEDKIETDFYMFYEGATVDQRKRLNSLIHWLS
jgi:hypothetical protein